MIGISREVTTSQVSKLRGPIVFLLSSPRSGSTLLRVMLAGHPSLFCPPELNLLPYVTMGERSLALGTCQAIQCVDQGCDARDGLLRALMELKGINADAAGPQLDDLAHRNRPVAEVYEMLQQLAAPRTVVDKSPVNAATIETLRRAEQLFRNPLYIHLIRHPYAVIESLVRQNVDVANAPQPEDLAEKYWSVTNSNILEFLKQVERERQHPIQYEALVSNSTEVMSDLCDFLRLPFDEAVLKPYEGDRMITGPRSDSLSLGDPNFIKHHEIEQKLGEVWKEIKLPNQLGSLARQLAVEFNYELPNDLSAWD